MNAAAYVHACERIDAVRLTGGSLEPTRLKTNMLSSMPMCFNLFGALRDQPEVIELVRATLDSRVESIERIECEWAPPRAHGLDDNTAFDATVVTKHADGSHHLIGVETKFTEPFSPKEYADSKYQVVHRDSQWFHADTEKMLVPSATNQLWRNTLLAARCVPSGHARDACVIVVAPRDDSGAQQTVEEVRRFLIEPDRCRFVALETIVEAARGIDGAIGAWARQFERRYLDLEPLG